MAKKTKARAPRRVDPPTGGLEIRYVRLSQLEEWDLNPKLHDEGAILESIYRHGFKDPPKYEPALNGGRGGVVEGNGRAKVLRLAHAEERDPPRGIALLDDGGWAVPVIFGVDAESQAEAEAYGLAHNVVTVLGGQAPEAALAAVLGMSDQGRLAQLMARHEGSGAEGDLMPGGLGAELMAALQASADAKAAEGNKQEGRVGALRERFIMPPFSVMDARQGDWRERKRLWLSLGIRSEVGRGRNLLQLGAAEVAKAEGRRGANRAPLGQSIRGQEDGWAAGGTSVFDPVLCELVYRWFSPTGGTVMDPFAGGSVRGVVASVLGRRYHGVELRAEQVEANAANWAEITTGVAPAESGAEVPRLEGLEDLERPQWIVGDSVHIRKLLPGKGKYDLLFTCPPYGSLERYSDEPEDLSTMDHGTFLKAYRKIVAASLARLKLHRFAAVVVGDYRDGAGHLQGLVGDTVEAFRAGGASLYNDAVLVTAAGSLPLRVSRHFPIGRKLGKTHQYVLVFVKGGWRKAAQACGPIEAHMPMGLETDSDEGGAEDAREQAD